MATVLVKAGRRYFKVRVNPSEEVSKEVIKRAARDLIFTSEGEAVRAGEKAVRVGSLDFEIVEDMKDAVVKHITHSELANHISKEAASRIATIAIQRAWPKVFRVNPLPKNDRDMDRYAALLRAYVRQAKRKRLASMIRLHLQIIKMERELHI